MTKGSQPTDGGNLLLTLEEKNQLIEEHPIMQRILKRFIGAHDFLAGEERFCIWINADDVDDWNKNETLKRRFENVYKLTIKSTKKATRDFASKPYQFTEIRHKDTESILVPSHTSEKRKQLPLGFFNERTIIGNSALVIYNAEPWIFGIISSKLHMVWIKAIGGKLKSDYRYSAQICYNTFPFPEISKKQKQQINLHVFAVLEEREKHPEKTLAQLYDPDKMPKGLKEAHHELDLAIERCYRLKPFTSDTERLEYLFKEYEKMIHKNTLLEKPKRKRKKKVR